MFIGGILLAAVFSLAGAQSNDQYWHERYHGILSMAAYGDYDTLCPAQTFNNAALQKSFPGSTSKPWEVIERFGPTPSGAEGFVAIIPEMDKVVLVFKGYNDWQRLSSRPVDINAALSMTDCVGCTAHEGALRAYVEAREATNRWQLAELAVAATGHQWSVTGHGFGGMLAQIAALDLGWADKLHWSHNHGSPRVFSPAAAARYNRLFQGEAGQRVVANDDILPTLIPESADYTFTLQGIHVYGRDNNASSPFRGHMNWHLCAFDPRDPQCAGGNSLVDTGFYYTLIGTCGASHTADLSYQAEAIADLGITAFPDGSDIGTLTSRSSNSLTTTLSTNGTSTTETTSTSESMTTTSSVGTETTTTSSGTNGAGTSTTTTGSSTQTPETSLSSEEIFGAGIQVVPSAVLGVAMLLVSLVV